MNLSQCKQKCSGLKWLAIGVLLGSALVFLTSCGTARGVIDGLESTGAGVLQDLSGAVDGINRADDAQEEGGN